MQAGARQYPAPPLPKQHLAKPGREADLEVAPINPADVVMRRACRSSARKTPMKRPAQPEEIAPAFVFLAAPTCSSYITGEILPIIGGYSGG